MTQRSYSPREGSPFTYHTTLQCILLNLVSAPDMDTDDGRNENSIFFRHSHMDPSPLSQCLAFGSPLPGVNGDQTLMVYFTTTNGPVVGHTIVGPRESDISPLRLFFIKVAIQMEDQYGPTVHTSEVGEELCSVELEVGFVAEENTVEAVRCWEYVIKRLRELLWCSFNQFGEERTTAGRDLRMHSLGYGDLPESEASKNRKAEEMWKQNYTGGREDDEDQTPRVGLGSWAAFHEGDDDPTPRVGHGGWAIPGDSRLMHHEYQLPQPRKTSAGSDLNPDAPVWNGVSPQAQEQSLEVRPAPQSAFNPNAYASSVRGRTSNLPESSTTHQAGTQALQQQVVNSTSHLVTFDGPWKHLNDNNYLENKDRDESLQRSMVDGRDAWTHGDGSHIMSGAPGPSQFRPEAKMSQPRQWGVDGTLSDPFHRSWGPSRSRPGIKRPNQQMRRQMAAQSVYYFGPRGGIPVLDESSTMQATDTGKGSGFEGGNAGGNRGHRREGSGRGEPGGWDVHEWDTQSAGSALGSGDEEDSESEDKAQAFSWYERRNDYTLTV